MFKLLYYFCYTCIIILLYMYNNFVVLFYMYYYLDREECDERKICFIYFSQRPSCI